MAGEKKLSQLDETLVKVLDRLSDDIGNHKLLLDEIKKRQTELSLEIERTLARQFARHDTTDKSIERSTDTVLRFRSDMLSLVNEQDRLNEITGELAKKQTAIAFSQDNLVNTLNELSKRLEIQEKAIRDLSAHSLKHEEALSREMSDNQRNFVKMHADTEKRMGEMQKTTQLRLDDVRHDTMYRLRMLDEIESSLNVLLVRTEPRKRKPFYLVRLSRRLRMRYGKARVKRDKEGGDDVDVDAE